MRRNKIKKYTPKHYIEIIPTVAAHSNILKRNLTTECMNHIIITSTVIICRSDFGIKCNCVAAW